MFMENLRGAKISMENLRSAKISVEDLRGLKNFYYFPKNTPTGYPDLKKTGPLEKYNVQLDLLAGS